MTRVTLDSIRNSYDVFIKSTKIGVFNRYAYIDITERLANVFRGVVVVEPTQRGGSMLGLGLWTGGGCVDMICNTGQLTCC